MKHSLQIHLKNLHFFSFHGIYHEEKVCGNQFEVNITIDYTPNDLPITHISQTINYVNVFSMIEKKMAIPTELLETIAQTFSTEILQQFPLADKVFISIDKMNPPIKNIDGRVGISYTLQRD